MLITGEPVSAVNRRTEISRCTDERRELVNAKLASSIDGLSAEGSHSPVDPFAGSPASSLHVVALVVHA
jgi:hypothetical protein